MLDFVSKKDLEERFLDKKIYSALCAIFFSDTVYNFSEKILKEKFVFWPDGMSSKLVKPNLKLTAGRYMLLELIAQCKKNNKKITFAGSKVNLTDHIFDGLNYNFIDLPFDSVENLSVAILKQEISDVLVLCVSSPKQEQIAVNIFEKVDVPIYCFGAALNLLTGKEVVAPKILEIFRLEGVWRILTGDTLRRLGHLKRFPKGYRIFSRFS